jgi:hypothetical protein
MFLICCSQFRASSVSRCSLEKPCWNLVRGHSSTMCWMVSFSAPHSQEGFSRMFQGNNILLHLPCPVLKRFNLHQIFLLQSDQQGLKLLATMTT